MQKFEEYQDSIYYFKRGEFKNYIQGIADKSLSVSDAFATFRELKYLPNKFKQMTVRQVADDPRLIGEIYEGLMKMQPQSKYKLPYTHSPKIFSNRSLESKSLQSLTSGESESPSTNIT
ncbi:MAG: hypothetical protein WAM14_07455 [Candidatus Nitrosopolaris sp.]